MSKWSAQVQPDNDSLNCLRCFQNLFRPRAHPVVLRQVNPTHRARRVQQKLARPGNVATAFSGSGVNQVVAANRLRFRIRKKSKCVPGFLTKVARLFRTVHADGNRANPYFFKLIQIGLDTPQLGVA